MKEQKLHAKSTRNGLVINKVQSRPSKVSNMVILACPVLEGEEKKKYTEPKRSPYGRIILAKGQLDRVDHSYTF